MKRVNREEVNYLEMAPPAREESAILAQKHKAGHKSGTIKAQSSHNGWER